MCLLFASLYLDCGHLTFHPAICALNMQFLKDVLEPGDIVEQVTATTLTIRTSEGDFRNLMAETFCQRPQYHTFSKTTPAYSALDCTHFDKERGVTDVFTFSVACPACSHAHNLASSAIPSKSSNRAVSRHQRDKTPRWKHLLKRHILQSGSGRPAPQDSNADPARECDLYFLSLFWRTRKRARGLRGLFQRLTTSGRNEKLVFERECEHLQSIAMPRSLLEDLKEGRMDSEALRHIASTSESGGKLAWGVTGEEQCWTCAREELKEEEQIPDPGEDEWEWLREPTTEEMFR
jgi:hypothetical protein